MKAKSHFSSFKRAILVLIKIRIWTSEVGVNMDLLAVVHAFPINVEAALTSKNNFGPTPEN